MTMHDERWTLSVAESGDVRLHDIKTGITRGFAGGRSLYDALGVLADWREAVPHNTHYGASDLVKSLEVDYVEYGMHHKSDHGACEVVGEMCTTHGQHGAPEVHGPNCPARYEPGVPCDLDCGQHKSGHLPKLHNKET